MAVCWLPTIFLQTEPEPGHCLHTPAEDPCEWDVVLTLLEVPTASEYAPGRARLDREDKLIADADQAGGSGKSSETKATRRRLEHPPRPGLTLTGCVRAATRYRSEPLCTDCLMSRPPE